MTPRASSNRVISGRDIGVDYLVYVTSVPEGGKANNKVLKLLANELGVPKTSLKIAKGQNGRNKVIILTA